jgi:hypothetical protein
MIDEKHGAEIFDCPADQTAAIVWWLVHLLGGEVKIPMSDDFWDSNMQGETWLTLHREDDKVVLRANERN